MAERHVKLHALGCPFDILRSVEKVGFFIETLIKHVGMRPLDKTHAYDIRETLERQGLTPYPDEPEGVSAVCVLSTSHAAICTWPHRGYAVIDLYSCRDFDPNDVKACVREVLQAMIVKCFDVSSSLEGLDEQPIIYPPLQNISRQPVV